MFFKHYWAVPPVGVTSASVLPSVEGAVGNTCSELFLPVPTSLRAYQKETPVMETLKGVCKSAASLCAWVFTRWGLADAHVS